MSIFIPVDTYIIKHISISFYTLNEQQIKKQKKV